MCRFTLLSLLFRFMVFSAKGEPNIIVVQNMDGIDITISSTVEARSGSNISLVCKVVDTENKERVTDRVVWSSKRKKIKFYNSRDINTLMENNIPDTANNFLNFTPITLKDEGTYLCVSSRYRQLKAVYIAVRRKAFHGTSLWNQTSRQRRHYNYRKFLPDHDVTINKPQNQEDPIKHEYLTHWEGADGSHKIERVSTDQPDVLLKFIYMLLAAVGMFLLLYAVTKCCHDDSYNPSYIRNRRAQRNRRRADHRQNANAIDTARCTHPVCIQCRHDASFRGCLFELHNVPTIRVERPQSPRPTVIPNIDHDDLLSSLLDLPPTYADSTANSPATSMYNLNDISDSFSTAAINEPHRHVSPPTYEQALINIVISPPEEFDTFVRMDEGGENSGDRRGSVVSQSGGSGRNG